MAYIDLCKLQPEWHALTRLSLSKPHHDIAFTPQEAAGVLSVTPNIEHCTIHFSEGAADPQEFVPLQHPIALPKLHTLIMRGTEVPIEFTAIPDIPSLTNLSSIQSYGLVPKDENHSAIVELIRRYGEQLTGLTFVFGSVTPLAFERILRSVPNVVSLELVGEDPKLNLSPSHVLERQGLGTFLRVNLLQRLIPRDTDDENGAYFCPKIQTLVCRLDMYDSEDDLIKERIVDLVSGRRRGSKTGVRKDGVAWLESISVAFKAGPIDWMMEELRKRGVDTEHVKFSAQYPDRATAPTSMRLNVPLVPCILSMLESYGPNPRVGTLPSVSFSVAVSLARG